MQNPGFLPTSMLDENKPSLSTTFSVTHIPAKTSTNFTAAYNNDTSPTPIYHFNNHSIAPTPASDIKNSQSNESSMSAEEYVAWKKAPPPNLQPNNTNEEQSVAASTTVTPKVPQSTIKHHPGVIITPSSKNQETVIEPAKPILVNKQVSHPEYISQHTTQETLIREDAQVTDINERKITADSENEQTQNVFTVSKNTFNFPDQPQKNKTNFSDLIKNNFQMSEIPFNSVIDGEVPFKERARAIKFEPTHRNLPLSESKNLKEINDKDISRNVSSVRAPAIHKEAPTVKIHPNSQNYYFGPISSPSFNPNFQSEHHTLPPTILRPPRFKVNYSQTASPYQTRQQIYPHPPVYYFGQHRRFPRPALGLRLDSEPTVGWRNYPNHVSPSFLSTRYPTPFYRPSRNSDKGVSILPIRNRERQQHSELRTPKWLPFFSAVPAFKRISGHLRNTVSIAPNLPPGIASRMDTHTPVTKAQHRRNSSLKSKKIPAKIERRVATTNRAPKKVIPKPPREISTARFHLANKSTPKFSTTSYKIPLQIQREKIKQGRSLQIFHVPTGALVKQKTFQSMKPLRPSFSTSLG